MGRHRRHAPRTRDAIATAAPRTGLYDRSHRSCDACEQRLAAVVSGHADALSGPARATLSAGGKRLRPLLVFCAAPRGRGRGRGTRVSAATAVELVHMATLVHDDIIDRASLRRGRPTVAQAEGPEVALRVGDFLFARAFTELTHTGMPRAVQALAAAALELSRGEMVQQAAAHDLALSEEAYLSRCRGKTASLFAVACRLGADGRRRGPRHRGPARRVRGARGHGLPDLRRHPRPHREPGGDRQAPGHRPARGHRHAAGDPRPQARAGARARDPGPRNGGGIDALCDRLSDHAGVIEARDRALAFVGAARDARRRRLDGVASGALLEIADGVVDRYS